MSTYRTQRHVICGHLLNHTVPVILLAYSLTVLSSLHVIFIMHASMPSALVPDINPIAKELPAAIPRNRAPTRVPRPLQGSVYDSFLYIKKILQVAHCLTANTRCGKCVSFFFCFNVFLVLSNLVSSLLFALVFLGLRSSGLYFFF